MSATQRKIRAEFERRGYEVTELSWQPLGVHVLFSGREGGWWVVYHKVDPLGWDEEVGGESWRDLVFQAFGEEP